MKQSPDGRPWKQARSEKIIATLRQKKKSMGVSVWFLHVPAG